MKKKTLSILGSTGSIGKQTLEVAKHLGFPVTLLTANSSVKLLEEQAREFKPEKVWIGEKYYKELKSSLADTSVKVYTGEDELCDLAYKAECDLLCNSLLGTSGLKPTVAAIEGNHDIALSNKEVLVAGGSLVTKLAKTKKTSIIPVDSEHSAIFQCMNGKKPSKIYLTASGGPFFGKDKEFLSHVTPKDALRHPNWSMGAKIMVDSATMMNKGLEIIEAVWLFGVRPEDIEVLVHRESIVHSMVGFEDNTVIAQLARPDMRLCIQYALTYPERFPSLTESPDFAQIGKLTFASPDYETFPLLSLAKAAISRGGNIPCAMSAANEAAVKLFLEEKIGFTDIFSSVKTVTDNTVFIADPTLEQLMQTDLNSREAVISI